MHKMIAERRNITKGGRIEHTQIFRRIESVSDDQKAGENCDDIYFGRGAVEVQWVFD